MMRQPVSIEKSKALQKFWEFKKVDNLFWIPERRSEKDAPDRTIKDNFRKIIAKAVYAKAILQDGWSENMLFSNLPIIYNFFKKYPDTLAQVKNDLSEGYYNDLIGKPIPEEVLERHKTTLPFDLEI